MSFVGMSIFCDLDTFFDPEKFPEGLHTHIEEQSSKLSGGERQRLVLARALIRSSHVLLLDEAFSALDLTTRRRIEAQVVRRRSGRTIVTISHNISPFFQQQCDTILCLHRGAVAEQGAHADLVSLSNGLYAQLLQSAASTGGTNASDDHAEEEVEE
eukprot:INCI8271.2.p4 GENE.INCI8271.2~~INCI8271.2.p4  ORF type:complete len:157 (+),score=33.88 INCI8271.2:1411-1881(+)